MLDLDYASGTVIGDERRTYKGRHMVDVGFWMGSDVLGFVCVVDVTLIVLLLLVSSFERSGLWESSNCGPYDASTLNGFVCGGYKGAVVGSGQLVALQSTLDDS